MIKKLLILLIKIYKFLISPWLGSTWRSLPTCAEYFIDSLNEHGTAKGLYKGFKRNASCHPIKVLGGGSGFDPVKKKVK